MSVNAPFTPTGNTVVVTASNPAQTAVQVSGSNGGSNQYRIVNSGSTLAFMGYGANATVAQSSANQITSTQNNCLVMLPGATEVLSFTGAAYFSANATSSTTLYITPGDGS